MQNKNIKNNKNKRYCCQCKKCGDKMLSNTNKKMVYCKCGLITDDGSADYTRIMGDEKNYTLYKN